MLGGGGGGGGGGTTPQKFYCKIQLSKSVHCIWFTVFGLLYLVYCIWFTTWLYHRCQLGTMVDHTHFIGTTPHFYRMLNLNNRKKS